MHWCVYWICLVACLCVAAAHGSGPQQSPISSGHTSLGSDMSLLWTLDRSNPLSPVFAMTLTIDAGLPTIRTNYGALGFLATSGMAGGHVVICWAYPRGVGGAYDATCREYASSNYFISPTADTAGVFVTAVTTSSTNPGAITVSYNMSATLSSGKQLTTGATQRLLYSTGPVDTSLPSRADHWPEQHYARGDIAINFASGRVGVSDSKKTAASVVLGVVMGVMFVIAAVTHHVFRIGFSARQQTVLRVLVVMLFIGTAVAYGALYGAYAEDADEDASAFRGIGHVAVMCFYFVLYPVGHYVVFPLLLGIAFDRAIVYHQVIGIMLTIAVTVHMVGMWAKYGASRVTEWKYESDMDMINPLAGLLAWVLLMIMVIFAVFLRGLFWEAFRVTHILSAAVLVYACLHYKKLIFGLIPALLFYAVDVVARIVVKSRLGSATINAVQFEPISGVSRLQVRLPRSSVGKTIGPGSYFLVSIPALRLFEAHPFSVAWYCRCPPPESNGKPNSSEMLIDFFIKAQNSRSFTSAVLDGISRGSIRCGEQLSLEGPLGNFSFPLEAYFTVVLVCGGIGVTPMLGAMAYICHNPHKVLCQHVSLIWSAREEELVHFVFSTVLAQLTQMLIDSGKTVNIRIFVTGKVSTSPAAGGRSVGRLPSDYFVGSSRPDIRVEINAIAAGCLRDTKMGIAACGPPGLVGAVSDAATSVRPANGIPVHYHQESFNL